MPRRPAWPTAGLLALLVPCGQSESPPSPVFGVSPADQAKYQRVGSEGEALTFRCFRSSSIAGLEAPDNTIEAFPFSVVNDNFCDCPDGSDEPGTAACAGQQQTLFYCHNDRSQPRYIYTSRVGDGVCDCCDGSDEHSLTQSERRKDCTNTCEEEGRALRKLQQQKDLERQRGVKKRQDFVNKGRKEFQAAKVEMEKLQAKLPALEEEHREATSTLEVARKKLAELMAGPTSNATAANSTNESSAEGESMSSASSAAVPVSDSAQPADDNKAAAADASSSAQEQPAISEYTKWMEGAEAVVGSGGDEAEEGTAQGSKPAEVTKSKPGRVPAPPPPPRSDAHLPYSCGPGRRRVWDCDDCSEGKWDDAARKDNCKGDCKWSKLKARCELPKTTWQHLMTVFDIFMGYLVPRWKPPEEKEVARATKAVAEAKEVLGVVNQRIKELEKILEADTDEKLAHRALEDLCLSKKVTEFNYEICFYKKAKQDTGAKKFGTTTIGSWAGWEATDIASFTEGWSCPGGVKRSLRVMLQCGAKEEIESVEEPARCAYEAVVRHPAACREGAQSDQARPRMPSDEL